MKLVAKLNNQTHQIDIRRDGISVTATVDDREYLLEASEVEPDLYLLKHNNKIYQVYVAPTKPARVTLRNFDADIEVSDPRRLRANAAESAHAGGAAEIRTAMPGKVVRILVSEGDAVKAGDGVLVVEAMKMQNEMKAPKDGSVIQIKIKEGDTVSAGDILAVIE
jgi:biotin carboxyl carrier protein